MRLTGGRDDHTAVAAAAAAAAAAIDHGHTCCITRPLAFAFLTPAGSIAHDPGSQAAFHLPTLVSCYLLLPAPVIAYYIF